MARKYNEVIDRESAFEMLEERLKDSEEDAPVKPATRKESTTPTRREESTIEKVTKNTMVRQVGNTLMRELARGLLGVLGLKSTTRRRR
jgi:hypothetical protein